MPLGVEYVRREREDVRMHCAECLDNPPAFNDTLTLADYRAPLDTLAVELKFRGQLTASAEFARHLRSKFEDSGLLTSDVIVPVSLSAKRLIERGYNQALAIARPLARRLHVPADATLLTRKIDTAQQSKFDVDARRRNVANAFDVQRDIIRGKHIGVVDDVMTSGATLGALARTLKLAGARRATNFVALRTPQD